MSSGYKISYELFLYMLSNLNFLLHETLWLNVYDENLVKEIRSWLEEDKKTFRNQKVTVDIGPFLGVFPNAMDMYMTIDRGSYATVIFLFDCYVNNHFGSWKDWFILPEDKYRMEVTEVERIS